MKRFGKIDEVARAGPVGREQPRSVGSPDKVTTIGN